MSAENSIFREFDFQFCKSQIEAMPSTYLKEHQNHRFHQASVKFGRFYNKRRAAFAPLTADGVEKRYREQFRTRYMSRDNKHIVKQGFGTFDEPFSEEVKGFENLQ